MATGAAQFHRYLKQQRAMGRSQPTRADKAAYLQGDIQAKLALADQTRRTSLMERAQETARTQAEAQLGLQRQAQGLQRKAQKTAKKQWEKQFNLQEEQAEKQDKWNKIRGVSELVKLGMEATPYLKSGGKWLYGKFTGGDEPSYDSGYDIEFDDAGYGYDDFDFGGGVDFLDSGGTDYDTTYDDIDFSGEYEGIKWPKQELDLDFPEYDFFDF